MNPENAKVLSNRPKGSPCPKKPFRPISEEELALIRQAQQTHAENKAQKDKDALRPNPAMETLVQQHLGLILSIARKTAGLYGDAASQRDDVIHEGVIALMESIVKYNCDDAVRPRLVAYAYPSLLHTMRRYLVKEAIGAGIKVPRAVRDLAKQIAEVNKACAQKDERRPTIQELGTILGKEEQEIQKALGYWQLFQGKRSQPAGEDEEDPTALMEDAAAVPVEETLDRTEKIRHLKQAISQLRSDWQRLIHLHYEEQRSLAEIAREDGESEATLRGWHKRALETLKRAMKKKMGKALEIMPLIWRTVLEQRKQGVPSAEIAEQLGEPIEIVQSWYNQALQLLRQRLSLRTKEMTQLPAEDQELMQLYAAGQSISQSATQLGQTESVIRERLARALKCLLGD